MSALFNQLSAARKSCNLVLS
ncbi:hypothetical protein V1477_000042 [Vespula maculifrons]|uniref:Uncharacterized protein n=1 Tax=Vespula maculifrons TaxID=7453 RepID=A0ABD2D2W6_VESMC